MRAVLSAIAGVLGFYGAVVAITLVIGLLLSPQWTEGPFGLAIGSLPLVAATLAVYAVFVRNRWSTWSGLGWPGRRQAIRGAAVGLVVGVAMAFGALLVAVVLGTARIELTGEPVSAYLPVAIEVAVGLTVAALAEELLFRGYPLVRLARAAGKVRASVVLAAVFALIHLWNPEVSTMGLVNIGLASLVLSAAFFTPGGLPAAWGVHFGWNGGLGLGADAPVSGIAFRLPTLEFVTGEPTWVTGGSFGPEGGLASTAAMGVALIWLGRLAARSKEQRPT